jgi:hypothetical protein
LFTRQVGGVGAQLAGRHWRPPAGSHGILWDGCGGMCRVGGIGFGPDRVNQLINGLN